MADWWRNQYWIAKKVKNSILVVSFSNLDIPICLFAIFLTHYWQFLPQSYKRRWVDMELLAMAYLSYFQIFWIPDACQHNLWSDVYTMFWIEAPSQFSISRFLYFEVWKSVAFTFKASFPIFVEHFIHLSIENKFILCKLVWTGWTSKD